MNLVLIITTLLIAVRLAVVVRLLAIRLIVLIVSLLPVLRISTPVLRLWIVVLGVLLGGIVSPILLVLLAMLKGLSARLKSIGVGSESACLWISLCI